MSFTSDIKGFELFANGVTIDTKRETCLAMFGAVIMDSPVGNPDLWQSQQHKPLKDRKGPPGYTGGRFRANWICTLRQPAIGTSENLDLENLDDMKQTVTEMVGDESVFLSNNLPYGEPLENGHSKQAPFGMVKKNVVRFQAIIDDSIRKARSKHK